MTRERKILLSVLGIGVFAVGVDRLILADSTSPSSAQAAIADVSAAAAVAVEAPANHASPTNASAAPAASPPGGPTVADRLGDFADRYQGLVQYERDGFLPGGQWGRTEPVSEAAPVTKSDPVAVFRSENTVTGTMGSGRRSLAIVNGQPLAVGDRIGQFVLVEIRDRAVTFTADGRDVTLTVATGAER